MSAYLNEINELRERRTHSPTTLTCKVEDCLVQRILPSTADDRCLQPQNCYQPITFYIYRKGVKQEMILTNPKKSLVGIMVPFRETTFFPLFYHVPVLGVKIRTIARAVNR